MTGSARTLAALLALAALVLTACEKGKEAPAVLDNPDPWGETDHGLTLSLRADKTTLKEGEPITVEVRARNDLDKAIRLYHFDTDWYYRVDFENLGDGPDFLGGAGLFIEYEKPQNLSLEPGEVFSRKAKLSEEKRRYLRIIPDRKPGDDWDYRESLPPGTYRATVTFESTPPGVSFWKGKAVSNRVKFVVEKDE